MYMNTFKIYILGKKPKTIIFGDKDGVDHDNVIYSKYNIFEDDTIQTIKNKILLSVNFEFSYEEMYLFSKSHIELNKELLYQLLFDEKDDLIKTAYDSFFVGCKDKPKLNFNNLDEIKGKYEFNSLLGNAFYKNFDFMFPINPYDCKSKIDENKLVIKDNSLLLDFGILNNEIYLCLFHDVVKDLSISEDLLIKLYYPFLNNKNINSLRKYNDNKDLLIEQSKKNIPKDLIKYYDILEIFEKINERKEEFDYESIGIKSIQMDIANKYDGILPLSAIFKNIHASKKLPIIKYSPGYKRESMYRLYSENIAQNGSKIPYLSYQEISKYSKDLGKNESISLILKHSIDEKEVSIYIHFKKNGNISVETSFKKSVDITVLEDLFKKELNDILTNINESLENIGYKVLLFDDFTIPNVSVKNIEYEMEVKIEKNIDLSKNRNLFFPLFLIKSTNINKNIDLIFKRVSNYKNISEIHEFIAIEKRKDIEMHHLIESLQKQFSLSDIEAKEELIKFSKTYDFQNDESLENGGFPITMSLKKSENILKINTTQINNIKFLEILKNYYEVFVTYYQKKDLFKDIQKDIDTLTKKEINEKIIEKNIIDTVAIVPKIPDDIIESKVDSKEKTDDEEEIFGMDEDDEIFGMYVEEDEDEEDEEVTGGAEDVINVEGMKLKNPNPFQDRIEKLDPKIVLKKDQGKFRSYSTTCAANRLRQPVILNNKELENIDKNHPESYTTSMNYGTDESKKYNYICPRYWSLKDKVSLTAEEVNKILKTNPKAIIPPKSATVPKGAFIFEFNTPVEHIENGRYIPHYPGLILDKHPDGYGIPCCFKTKNKGLKDKKEDIKTNNYVVDANKYPLNEERLGMISEKVENFFQVNNKTCITPNSALKKNKPCLFRYGIEQNILKSFIGCIAYIYKIHQLKANDSVPRIEEMVDILVDNLSLDKFIKYQNGSLVSIFKANIDIDTDIKPYKDTEFYKLSLKENKQFLTETIVSYENFLSYLKDPNAFIDHTFLWDMLCEKNSNLIPTGINLVILNDDINKSSIEIICPTNPYNDVIFNENLKTFFILKQEDFYEPLCLYEVTKTELKIQSTFKYDDKMMKGTLQIVKNKMETFCGPRKSITSDIEMPIHIKKTVELLKTNNIKIVSLIMNFQAKIIGVLVEYKKQTCYIPCLPSTYVDLDINETRIINDNIWNSYENTKSILTKISELTNNVIKCKPYSKVIQNNYIIGIKTIGNQFVKISKPILNYDNMDDLEIDFNVNDEIIADMNINIISHKNTKQEDVVKNLKYENEYYTAFRTTLRILLSNFENKKYKSEIYSIVKSDKKYETKVNEVYNILKGLSGDYVRFGNVDLNKINEIGTCFNKCESDSCVTLGKECILKIPKKNLLEDHLLNYILYHTRLADEIVRIYRIRSFMLEPNKFLNMTNYDYKINKDEILLLDSFISKEYFNELELFRNNEYINNISFDIARPNKKVSNKHSNKTKLLE